MQDSKPIGCQDSGAELLIKVRRGPFRPMPHALAQYVNRSNVYSPACTGIPTCFQSAIVVPYSGPALDLSGDPNPPVGYNKS